MTVMVCTFYRDNALVVGWRTGSYSNQSQERQNILKPITREAELLQPIRETELPQRITREAELLQPIRGETELLQPITRKTELSDLTMVVGKAVCSN